MLPFQVPASDFNARAAMTWHVPAALTPTAQPLLTCERSWLFCWASTQVPHTPSRRAGPEARQRAGRSGRAPSAPAGPAARSPRTSPAQSPPGRCAGTPSAAPPPRLPPPGLGPCAGSRVGHPLRRELLARPPLAKNVGAAPCLMQQLAWAHAACMCTGQQQTCSTPHAASACHATRRKLPLARAWHGRPAAA